MAAYGSLSPGSGVEYYTQGAGARAGGTNYYTGASGGQEPPGRWSGRGAEALGLIGEIDAKEMEDLYTRQLLPGGVQFGKKPMQGRSVEEILAAKLEAEPDALPERVREIEREAKRAQRQGRTFMDYTFSPDKSVSAAHTAAAYAEERARTLGDTDTQAHWGRVRETIEDAVHAGAAAAVENLASSGVGRTGSSSRGTVRFVDAQDWVVGTFFQHTSREGDPQLHVHNPILLETVKADGKVGKLDTETMKVNRAGATAVGARVMQEKISKDLGWTWKSRTDGNGHELEVVDQGTKDLFSERTNKITQSSEQRYQEYTDATGREPNALIKMRLDKAESLRLRPQKPGPAGETRAESIRRWDAERRAEVGEGLGRLASKLIVRPEPEAEPFSPSAVVAQAVARVQETNSTFTPSDLKRAVEAELPGYLGVGVDKVDEVLESLTQEALAKCTQVTGTTDYRVPEDFKLANGKSAYIRPGSERFSSDGHIRSEQKLQDAAIQRGRHTASADAADTWIDQNGQRMSLDQQAAVKGIMTSGAQITALVGPAGTGKTFTLGHLAKAWADTTGGRVRGLATSEQATEVMRGEDIEAKNMAQFLAAQRRLAEHRPIQGDHDWAIQENDILVPDEASMADTDRLSEVLGYADRAGARVVLAGDHRQLAAVGSGGAMDLIAGTDGADKYELAEVRRFTASWEGDASLDLRRGEKGVVDQYQMHDRIRAGGTAEETMRTAADLYVGDRLQGKSVVVVTATNAQAATVNGLVREKLVEAGRVNAKGVFLDRDGNHAGVGDIIKARKTTWDPGEEMRNQGRYLVKEVRGDGGLVAAEVESGAVRNITPEYVRQHVELGYAGTAHSTQGATVETAITVVQEGQSLEGLYVGMSRGRERNTAVVVTEKERMDPVSQAPVMDQPLDAAGVVANILEQDNVEAKAALTVQREALEQETSTKRVADLYEAGMDEFVQQRTSVWLDRMATNGVISEADRQRLASEKGTRQLGHLLRVVEQSGKDAEQVLGEAATGSLETANSVSQVLHARITRAHKGDLALDADRSVMPPADAPVDYQEHFEQLRDMRRERENELGAEQGLGPAPWAVETLGPVPGDLLDRSEWEHRAGVIAAHREATGWEHETEPLGSAPGTQSPEARASWAVAWDAAGRPEARAEEHDLSEGALRIRHSAMVREDAALPPNVFEEMKAVEQELYDSQQQAARYAAQADLEQDSFEAARLREAAAEHDSYAERWEAKRAGLQAVDDARRALMDEQAVTRELGQRARAELEQNRGVVIGAERDRCTAQEWLDREAEARVEDDQHRVIVDIDLAENTNMTNEREPTKAGLVAADDHGAEGVPSDLTVAEQVERTHAAIDLARDRRSAEAAHYEQDHEVRTQLPEPVVEHSLAVEEEMVWD